MASSVIGALRVNLGLDSAQFNKGAKQAQTTTQKLGSNLKKIGAAASVVGAGVALAIRGQLSAADQLGKTAQQLGVPVEALSQLQFAAKQSGVSMSGLETGLRRLSQNMAQDADKFTALGIAVRGANGEMRPTADVMADVADVLAAMPDGAEKTALAMDLMGRSGAEMIPLLNGGADALRDMMKEADALGLTISEDTAAAAAQFNDNLGRLTGQIQGVVRIITAQLAPVLAQISDAVVAVAQRFQGMSPEMQRFAGIAAGLAVAIGPILIGLGILVTTLGALSLPVLAVVAGIGLLVAGFVAFGPKIMEVKDNLVVLIRDGIDAAKAAFENGVQAVTDFKDKLIELGTQGVDFVKEKLRELLDFIMQLPAQMRQAGADLMNGLVEGITSGAARARDAVGSAARGVIDRFRRDTETRSPSRVFQRLGNELMNGLAVGIEERDWAATAAITSVTDKMKTEVGGAAQQVSGMFESAFVGIVTGSMKAREAIGRLLQDLARMMAQKAFQSLFGGFFGGGGGFLGGLFGGFKASGGPVSGGKAYVVGEKGPELFMPSGSGQIVPNHALGGEQQVVITLDLRNDMLDAKIAEGAGRVVVRQTPKMIQGALARGRENRSFD